jgi:hypothetical protein
MTDDEQHMTVDEWATGAAEAILAACNSKLGADVTMIQVAKIVIVLLTNLDRGGRKLPKYGTGWLLLVRDFCNERIKTG